MSAFDLLKILHFTAMAVWFGAGLFLSTDVRRTIYLWKERGPRPKGVPPYVSHGDKIPPIAGVVTVLSGVGLVMTTGGFTGISWRILTGLALAVVMLVMGGVVLQPTWLAIQDSLESDHDVARAQELAKRISIVTGIQHLLWLTILVLMVLRI